jgi:2-C-methyl-D-erythritol 2,4-cyclodiphosphate synthase
MEAGDVLSRLRVGLGSDRHRLVAGRRLVLGGVDIPHDRGLFGHSDADVLLHAVIDAILGALAEGDIGEWFPDSAEENKGRDSAEMLRQVLARGRSGRFRVLQLDATVFAEKPKLSPHKQAIRESLATLLLVPIDRVNVKAKTGETVGVVGREEAIDAQVVVLVEVLD